MISGLSQDVYKRQTYESRAVSIRESEVLSQAKILANKISTSKYFDEDGGCLLYTSFKLPTAK